MNKFKKDVSKELLLYLDDIISSEVSAMESHYTVTEVAQEIIYRIRDTKIEGVDREEN